MADRNLDLLDECAAGCVHLHPQEDNRTSFSQGDSKMYTPKTIANSQKNTN